MKFIKKWIITVITAVVAVVSLTACGQVTIDMKKISDKWTVSTIDGENTISEYAEMIGKKPIALARNFTITENSLEMTIYDPSRKDVVTVKYDVEPKFNSFYSKDGETIKGSYKYDSEKDTIQFTENLEGKEVVFTMKRGTTDIMALSEPKDNPDEGEEETE